MSTKWVSKFEATLQPWPASTLIEDRPQPYLQRIYSGERVCILVQKDFTDFVKRLRFRPVARLWLADPPYLVYFGTGPTPSPSIPPS
jgi:hypothetical protein